MALDIEIFSYQQKKKTVSAPIGQLDSLFPTKVTLGRFFIGLRGGQILEVNDLIIRIASVADSMIDSLRALSYRSCEVQDHS